MTTELQENDVLRRAELFNQIIRVVRNNDPEGQYFRHISARPQVLISDRQILFDGQVLDLAARPMSLKLFEVFLDTPDYVLDRKSLVESIYEVNLDNATSTRMVKSLYSNVVKLISRTRNHANRELSCDGKVQWFIYSNDQWCLFRKYD